MIAWLQSWYRAHANARFWQWRAGAERQRRLEAEQLCAERLAHIVELRSQLFQARIDRENALKVAGYRKEMLVGGMN